MSPRIPSLLFPLLLLLLLLLLAPACGGAEDAAEPRQAERLDGWAGAPAPELAALVIPAGSPRVVFLGDSLTAGLHLAADQAFPALLQRRLHAQGLAFELVNAGVSGDTTAGGRSRLDWLLKQEPDLMVVGLGANDGLRGIELDVIEENLRAILERLASEGVPVLLLGQRIPPSYGDEYAEGFATLYPELARELDVELVPFLLEGVGGRAELNLSDDMHPNPAGHERIADNVQPFLRRALERIEGGERSAE